MKNIVLIAALFALSFATGFTCSKNAPEQTATTTQETTTTATQPADAQAQMAASGDASQTTTTTTNVSGDTSMAQPETAPATTTK